MTLRLSEKSFQTKHCKVCRGAFYPFRSTDPTCADPACKREWVRQRELKKSARAARKELREYRARTMTIAKLKKLADREFGRYVRERDSVLPCVSAAAHKPDVTYPAPFTGGEWDCGHWRTKGAADHLRYDQRNAAKQCKRCNLGAGQNSGKKVQVDEAFKTELIRRLGAEVVDEIENDNRTAKWSRDELVAIRRKYLGMWKELRAKREAA